MTKKIHRNDPCPCNSGKKYKKCCGKPGMGRHTASILSSSNISGSLLGRISQAGQSFVTDRKVDMLSKGVTVGKANLKVTPPPTNTPEVENVSPEKQSEEKKPTSQENDCS